MSRCLSDCRVFRRILVAVVGMAVTAGVVQAATFQVTSTTDSGPGSLRQAIEDANNTAGADTIDLSPIQGGAITLEADLPQIVEDLNLQGNNVTLDGTAQHRCLTAVNADLGVDAMTITRCVGQFSNSKLDDGIESIEHQGGAIRVELGDLTLANATIINNAAPADTATEIYSLSGAGVFVTGAESVTIADSVIEGNTADEGAGGVQVDMAAHTVTISDSLITANVSDAGQGGALLIAGDGDIVLSNLTVSDNEGMAGAGGIDAESLDGAIQFGSSTISGNRSVEAAGGASLHTELLGDIVLIDVDISNNESDQGDGGLLAEAHGAEGVSGSVVLSDSVISNNTSFGTVEACPTGGGTLLSRYDEIVVSDTIISGNAGQGWAFGGLTASAYLGSNVERAEIIGNASDEGGGGLVSLGGLQLSDSTIDGNSGAGGGLMNFDFTYGSSFAALEIDGSTLSGNSASIEGGGALIFNHEGSIAIENSTVSGNSADNAAGLSVTGDMTAQVGLVGVTVTNNQATTGPGGGLLVTRSELSEMGEPNIVAVNGSILSGNSTPGGAADLGAGGEPSDVTFDVGVSLIGDAPGDGSAFLPDPVTSGLLGADPELGALDDYGGPTQTHLPAQTSPALDIVTVDEGCGVGFAIDQRGEARPDPVSGPCDAGSVERQGAPTINAAPDIDFGDILVEETAPPADATLENVGTEPLEIAGINGPDAPFTLDFADCSDALPINLFPGESCILTFGFQPLTVGTFNETVTFASNSDGGDNEIALTGRGTEPVLGYVDLDFGDQPLGDPIERALNLNNDGGADLLISELTLSGDAVFELVGDDCTDPVAPGTSCQANIRFTPDAAESFAATLSVTSNASEVPAEIGVTGQGIVGELSVTPSGGLDFGDVTLGETGDAELVLRNNGDAPIEIIGWSDPEAPFAIIGGNCPEAPFALDAGESCTLIFGFTPLSYGDYDQEMQFAVDDGGDGDTVALSLGGRGVVPIVPVPTLDHIGLMVGCGLLALLGLLGLQRRRICKHPSDL